MGFDVINSMYFTGCGDALSSAIISSLRGVVLLLAFTFIFPALWGMTGVWFVAPATEILTAVVSLFLINKQKNCVGAGDDCGRKQHSYNSKFRDKQSN